MFGIMVFALNEAKFIGYALRSYLASPLVEKIAVVEGCVRKNAHAGSEAGLSTDNTREVIEKAIAGDETDRIIYHRYGWAEGKSNLQNKCLSLLEEQAPGVAYFILAGADEIWDPPDLERLASEIKKHGNPDIPLCEFVHFWKRPDLRAKGSMWETWMHRIYRNHGKGMKFQFHAGPPLKPDGSKLKTEVKVKDVKIYHYTAMKDRKDILDRVRFYQERDNKGKDTWSNWSPGKPTQWTHGGGTAERYDGKHPAAIANDVWALTPDLPQPETKVFIPSAKSEGHDLVRYFVTELAKICPVTAIGLVNPRWPKVSFRKISNLKTMVDGIDLLINANKNLVLSPLAKRNVLFAYEPMPECKPLWSGWRIICLDEKVGKTWSGKARAIAHPAQMLLDLDKFPTVGVPRIRARGPTMGGSVGKPATPGKLGKAGKVRIVSTRPLVAAWSFVNPMDFKMKGRRSHIGYELLLASGRVIRTKRTITRTPDLAPGDGFQAEIVLPMDLPPSEYVVRFDFRTRDRWGSEVGVKPLEILYSIDTRRQIWVR